LSTHDIADSDVGKTDEKFDCSNIDHSHSYLIAAGMTDCRMDSYMMTDHFEVFVAV